MLTMARLQIASPNVLNMVRLHVLPPPHVVIPVK
jgi:hypothetical protein